MAFAATFALLIPTVGGGPLSAPIRIPAERTEVALTLIANGEDGVALGISRTHAAGGLAASGRWIEASSQYSSALTRSYPLLLR